MNNIKKIFSVFVALVIVLTIFFSMIFISVNTNHDCTGDGCPVCEQIQVAENVLSKLTQAVVSVAIAISLCVLAQGSIIVFSNAIINNFPIKLKVKMLN